MSPSMALRSVLLYALLSYVSCQDVNNIIYEKKICFGKGLTPENRYPKAFDKTEYYQELRDRYTNCTHVEGNLELKSIESGVDLGFLSEIREVTGCVLISSVSLQRLVLPSLFLIRGKQLCSYKDNEYSLLVTDNEFETFEMPSLAEIMNGSIGYFGNRKLCNTPSINWVEIYSGNTSKPYHLEYLNLTNNTCLPCDFSCKIGCWNSGRENCQKITKSNCSPHCSGKCFGPKRTDCCHPKCAGGCIGPNKEHCLACRDFSNGKECVTRCPPLRRINPFTRSMEDSPIGRYVLGSSCVIECPKNALIDGGECVASCGENEMAENGRCVPCNGTCEKVCKGVDVIHKDNIDSFRGCDRIDGSLVILDSTFKGFEESYHNFSTGPVHPPMNPSELEVFSSLKEITGYLTIQASHPEFKNLKWLKNLEVIGGIQRTEYFASLYIVQSSLESLNLRSLKTIHAGSVMILENKNLCFADKIKWEKITQSESSAHRILVSKNEMVNNCKLKGLVCDSQCNEDGCWGQGPEECLTCKGSKFESSCVESCETLSGVYETGTNTCSKCDDQCLTDCYGPGPSNCKICKSVLNEGRCSDACPVHKYNHQGICRLCHENCVDGCTGPGKKFGFGGCNKCERGALSMTHPNILDYCLKRNEPCPKGYYQEYIVNGDAFQHFLTGISYCRPCHPRCKSCTAYGFHVSVCECRRYSTDGQCADNCPKDYYSDANTLKCVYCDEQCKGCNGPTSSQCHSCRNFRVYTDNSMNSFTCVASCPFEKPFKIFDEGTEPYCSTENPKKGVVDERASRSHDQESSGLDFPFQNQGLENRLEKLNHFLLEKLSSLETKVENNRMYIIRPTQHYEQQVQGRLINLEQLASSLQVKVDILTTEIKKIIEENFALHLKFTQVQEKCRVGCHK